MRKVLYRNWQNEAFAGYLANLKAGKCSELWEATPGAGKTAAALRLIAHQLRTRRATSALIVVPTSHLRIQWSRAAAELGLHLDSNFSGGRTKLTEDFHGAVITYQQIGNRSATFRALAKRSVVILDEIHHAGDGMTWGNAVRNTLEGAPYVLALSGTAFRSDNNPIPFVTYDKDGLSAPDFTYPYARAVEERVCRPTAVFTYGGHVAWMEGEREVSADFSDSLDGIASGRRLRAALDPDVGWVRPMLVDAHRTLLSTRAEHPEAGALMVCADRQHARRLAKLLKIVTGDEPTVVLSDDASASRKIKEFADNTRTWLVACNMVSEGVDIPRLRVGVYGTTIRTKMYFRQFLGRIVRVQSHVPGLQVSYLYLPSDPTLHQLAEEIEIESGHIISRLREQDEDDIRLDRHRELREEPSWAPLAATNSGVNSVIVHGNQLALFGETMVQGVAMHEAVQREVRTTLDARLTRSEFKARIATQIKYLVGSYHRKSGKPHSAIHTLLNKAQGVKSQTHCTEVQLHERLRLLEQLCSDGFMKPPRAEESRGVGSIASAPSAAKAN